MKNPFKDNPNFNPQKTEQEEEVHFFLTRLNECVGFCSSLSSSFKSIKEVFEEGKEWINKLLDKETNYKKTNQINLIANSQILDYTFKHCIGNFKSAIQRAILYEQFISELEDKFKQFQEKSKSKEELK